MSHVDEGLLHAYLDGALVPGSDAYAAIREHLAQCTDCRVRLEEARALRDRAADALLAVSLDEVPMPPFADVVERSRGARSGRSAAPARARRVWFGRAAWAASVALALAVGWAAHGLMDGERARGPVERGAWAGGSAVDPGAALGDVTRAPTGGDPAARGGATRGATVRENGGIAAAARDVSGSASVREARTAGERDGEAPAALAASGGDAAEPAGVPVSARPARLAPPDPAPHLAGRSVFEPGPPLELPASGPPPTGRLVLADNLFRQEAQALAGVVLADADGGPAATSVTRGGEGVGGEAEAAGSAARGVYPLPTAGRGAANPRLDPGSRAVGSGRGLSRPAAGVAVAPSPGRVTGSRPSAAPAERRSLFDRFRRRERVDERVVAWIRITAVEAESWLGEPPLRVASLPEPEGFTVAADPGGPVRSVQRLDGGGELELVQWRARRSVEPRGSAADRAGSARGWPALRGVDGKAPGVVPLGAERDTDVVGAGAVRVLEAATGADGVAVVIAEVRGSGARLRLAAPVPLDELLELVPRLGPPAP